MADVVLAYNGFPIHLTVADKYTIQNANYSDLGTLWNFSLLISGNSYTITYFDKSDFKKEDQKQSQPGYYITESFYDYKNGRLSLDKLKNEIEVGWGYKHYLPTNDNDENKNWGLKLADEGDLVKIFLILRKHT